jgi:hypothetical protein
VALVARRAVEHVLFPSIRSQRHQALARAAHAESWLLLIESRLERLEVDGEGAREFGGGRLDFFKDLGRGVRWRRNGDTNIKQKSKSNKQPNQTKKETKKLTNQQMHASHNTWRYISIFSLSTSSFVFCLREIFFMSASVFARRADCDRIRSPIELYPNA